MSIQKEIGGESSILMINPDYKNKGMAIIVSFFCVFFIFLFFQSIDQIIKGNSHFLINIFLVFFFWGAFYNFFNFYWSVLGSEIVEINKNYVKHTKCVWFLRHSKKYNKNKLGRFKIVDRSNSFGAMGTAMFGYSDINIQFKYGRRDKMIGKQINQEEAEQILTELSNKNYPTQPISNNHME